MNYMVDKEQHEGKLLKIGYFRLEFSEYHQRFHLNRGTHAEGTHTYKTVCRIGEDRHLSKFIEYMSWKYEYTKTKPIKLSTVMKEFESYQWIVESVSRF
jgi:hypothetical protein